MKRKNLPKKQVVLICSFVFMCEKDINFAHVRMYV